MLRRNRMDRLPSMGAIQNKKKQEMEKKGEWEHVHGEEKKKKLKQERSSH